MKNCTRYLLVTVSREIATCILYYILYWIVYKYARYNFIIQAYIFFLHRNVPHRQDLWHTNNRSKFEKLTSHESVYFFDIT